MSPAATLQPADFVHLHVHSEYSFLDGANRIGPMLDYVKSIGQDALALTDHGVMCGILEFYNTAKKAGVRPIVGCEVYIHPKDRTARGAGEQKNTHHLLLLAQDMEGYRNLCKLSSIGFLEGFYYKPRIDFEVLAAHAKGLVATSSCLAGLIPQALLSKGEEEAYRLAGQFVDIFGKERFFIEVQDHGIREQKLTNGPLLDMAKKLGLRAIATNDAHYMRKEDAHMHDVLLCVQTGAKVAEQNRMKFDGTEFYLKSTEEMLRVFGDIPEVLTNTRLVAEMCGLEFPEKEYHLPRFPCPDGLSEADLLRRDVWEGAKTRYPNMTEEVRARIEYELSVIIKMGFPGYFLIVADFIAHARCQGIPVGPGRGSAAGSVVAYCLRITQLDPLVHGLLFERFLNPDRLSMPDIDIDFCFERRGEVIEYVRRKYGEDCVAQIITFGTMKAKAAVKDVARVFENPQAGDKLSKLIPGGDPKMSLEKAWAENPAISELVQNDSQYRKIWDNALQIEGMVRHASIHAAGIVISDRPLTEYCPLYKAPDEDKPATQFTMTEVEESIGLLKMDFLGIKNLTIIQRVCEWLKEREGIEIDFDAIGYADPKAYEVLCAGHTLGVFQLESEGMTGLVRKMQPSDFADLTALIALYRPGPLQAGMHTMYVDRKHGREPVVFDHPKLEPILGESYGTILYQEQVMRISVEMCGFTGGEADTLRKAMGKKNAAVMEKMRAKFVAGMKEHSGTTEQFASDLWELIVKFAGYGFNKSHSAAYAMVTYQTAYLRAHYPVYFMAALLTNELNGTTDQIAKYVSHCREIGIEVAPVEINNSIQFFNPDPANNTIYYALNGLKGVGEGFARAVIAERAANGPFKSLQDLCFRVPREELNSRVLEALIKVGAFDKLEPRRRALCELLPDLLAISTEVQKRKDEVDLFSDSDDGVATPMVTEFPLPKTVEWDDKERAAFEKEVLGFYLADHPLNRFKVEMESFADARSGQLEALAEEAGEEGRRTVRLVGMVQEIMERTGKNSGKTFFIVKLQDIEGDFEMMVWEDTFETYRSEIRPEAVVQVEGQLSQWNGRVSFKAAHIRRVEDLRDSARGLEVEWDVSTLTERALVQLKETCRRWSGTHAKPVRLVLRQGSVCVGFVAHGLLRTVLDPEALKDFHKLEGRPRVRYIPGPMRVVRPEEERQTASV